MSSTTPPVPPPQHARNASTTSATQARPRSRSRGATPPPLPTTPLRPPSRSSLRSSQTPRHHYSASAGPGASIGASGGSSAGNRAGAGASIALPLDDLEPAFADLADGMADLEANFMHLQLMHESLARFSEAFAAFLYGLGVNAFCADFPEQPTEESFRRAKDNPAMQQPDEGSAGGLMGTNDSTLDPDHTFLTTDTSFIENPPSTVRKSPAAPRYGKQPAARGGTTRGAATTSSTRGARGSNVPRGTTGRGRASGLARASTRGRGVYR